MADAARLTLEADIARLQRENRDSDAALAQVRADFARELDKLREDGSARKSVCGQQNSARYSRLSANAHWPRDCTKIWMLRGGGPSSMTSVIALNRKPCEASWATPDIRPG
ncbi:hypothetical protein BJG93_33245 (plasmid) [Paraburkholderia sprentiae WSM5005]|uniref:Uncharacterized protein n=1 Tax=Paraburkholderia sprentiae WSM5005 TaxID=754502 RepID=A0A1I9YW59_9BURK|nr:hypothetical protein [Paraburkholderia sprentiae]APA90452.1 hypothetical protein BJG93_33245 [Paraburkholderia sprentiae WSM5005]